MTTTTKPQENTLEDHVEVEIPAEGGVTLHAWLFVPSTGTAPFPAITMAHGFAGMKYRALRDYASYFTSLGFVVLVHDHRGFGLSGGEIRGDIDPWQQVSDWRRVISYLEALPVVDSDRIGLWGTSYAGGHGLVLGATDRRLKAVVVQVPTISGSEQSLRRVKPEDRPALEALYDADERGQLKGDPPARRAVVSLDPEVPAAYRSAELIAYHERFPLPDGVPNSGMITLRSSRKASMYDPGHFVGRVSPTPLLMIVASDDKVTPADLALDAYERALEPKRLLVIEDGHFDSYTTHLRETREAAGSWFLTHI
ncbi:alpha/beta hydrolase [Paenarthrobacter aurescens]|uniref:alpha/beta hydrolase n=1 Tax=Paenarthrobacter aurescens TaxID=43663 RepID=UPI0035EB8131